MTKKKFQIDLTSVSDCVVLVRSKIYNIACRDHIFCVRNAEEEQCLSCLLILKRLHQRRALARAFIGAPSLSGESEDVL